jgi:type IV secretory pathway protease TraF
MRCARCEFENIPGQTRCIRCGSILEAGGAVIEIYPPRMAAWRRPFRDVMRWLRGRRFMSRMPKVVRQGCDVAISDSLVGLVLNVIPGLPYLFKRRFREVRLLVLLWLVLLCATVLSYHSTIGAFLLGLTLAVHAWIGVRYGLIKEIEGFTERVALVLIVIIALALLYWAVPHVAIPGFGGAHTSLTIPALNVSTGDYFLVRRVAAREEPLPRGTLVLIEPPEILNAQRRPRLNRNQGMIGQIVGLPGETVRIERNAYVIGGQRLEPSRFPVPRWLQQLPPRSATGILVPDHSYFISTEYGVNVHGRAAVTDQAISNACIMRASDIRGRAFLHWWPLSNRRFLEP